MIDTFSYYKIQLKGKYTHYKWRWLGNFTGKERQAYNFPTKDEYQNFDEARSIARMIEKENHGFKARLIKVESTIVYSVMEES